MTARTIAIYAELLGLGDPSIARAALRGAPERSEGA
jgi:hypothetical protein